VSLKIQAQQLVTYLQTANQLLLKALELFAMEDVESMDQLIASGANLYKDIAIIILQN
jgi:hypothetical protein